MAKCIPMSIASDCCRLSMPRRQPDIPDFGLVAAGTRSVFNERSYMAAIIGYQGDVCGYQGDDVASQLLA